MAKRRGAVVQLAARLHRQSDEQQRVHVRGMLRENRELLHRRAQQLRLPEQVAALVPREAKLRKHDYLRVRFLQLADPPLDLHSVGNAVRNRHRRGHRRDAHKSVFHAVLLTVLSICLRDAIIIRQIGPERTGILRSRPLKCKEDADRTVFCGAVPLSAKKAPTAPYSAKPSFKRRQGPDRTFRCDPAPYRLPAACSENHYFATTVGMTSPVSFPSGPTEIRIPSPS